MKENRLFKIMKSLRILEALWVSGGIFVGSLFGIDKVGHFQFINLAEVFFISYTLMLSVYSINAYLGVNEDKSNPRLKALTLFSKTFYLITTITFYTISFVASLLVNSGIIYFHIIIFVLWFLYSLPGFGKHLPVLGTLIHFVVAIVQFNFAYSFFSPMDMSSLLISIYFALLFSAAHIHHEIIDYEVDAENEIKSSTVFWGIKHMKHLSLSMLLVAQAFWTVVAFSKQVNIGYYIIFATGFLFQCVFYIYYNGQFENNPEARLKYRSLYRIIFFICGIIFTLISLL